MLASKGASKHGCRLTLIGHAERVERELAKQFRPLADRDLAVVFYDLTTVRIHGEGTVEGDLRAFGMNKERGGIARQFVLGVVQSAGGLTLMHTVHPGNVAERKTLQAMLAAVLERQADRGLLRLENIGQLTALAARGDPHLPAVGSEPRAGRPGVNGGAGTPGGHRPHGGAWRSWPHGGAAMIKVIVMCATMAA